MVIPGDRRLGLKKAGALIGDKALRLASERDVVRVTGFQVGSVSVLGFRRDDIAGDVDRQVPDLPQVIIRAGRPERGPGAGARRHGECYVRAGGQPVRG